MNGRRKPRMSIYKSVTEMSSFFSVFSIHTHTHTPAAPFDLRGLLEPWKVIPAFSAPSEPHGEPSGSDGVSRP